MRIDGGLMGLMRIDKKKPSIHKFMLIHQRLSGQGCRWWIKGLINRDPYPLYGKYKVYSV